MTNWNDPEELRAYHRERYRLTRQKMYDYLGGKCVRCGSTENLEFDHIDRSTKSFNIKGQLSLKNPKVKDELDKCQLLCRSCHERKTIEESTGFTHGTTTGWQKAKCECVECSAAKAAWQEARNAKRRKTEGGRGPYKPRVA